MKSKLFFKFSGNDYERLCCLGELAIKGEQLNQDKLMYDKFRNTTRANLGGLK